MDADSIIRLATPEGRPATVLQVLPALHTGGVERGAVDVAAAVAAAGGRAVVASAGGPLERELERAGAHHVRLPMAAKNPLVMWRNVGRLERLIAEQEVDIVHARSRAPAWSALLAARRAGVPFVTTFHGTYGAGNAVKRRYNAVMARGERVIAISDFIAGHLRETYAVDPARIRVIPRGIDLERFDPVRVAPERTARLARAWGVAEGAPLVMLPGRLTRWKGQAVLVEALTRLADLDLRCLLVGGDQGGGYRRELRRLVARRGLGERVLLVDDCADMPAAYALADVVVSASTDPEAFGRVVAEAQAMGRPVVASAHGGVPEQVRPKRTAFLVPPGDPAALAGGLRRALALGPEQRAELAAEARAQACERFGKAQMCRRTLAVYAELLGGGAEPRAGHAGGAARSPGEAASPSLTESRFFLTFGGLAAPRGGGG